MFDLFLNRLKLLQQDQKSLWGIMTPQHMVEHLILSFQMSNGKLKLKCITHPDKLPSLKRFLLSERPLPKEYINPYIGPNLLPLKCPGIEDAVENLGEEINHHIDFFKLNQNVKTVHVNFGELNKHEWDQFHSKHFTHHLAQFNLI